MPDKKISDLPILINPEQSDPLAIVHDDDTYQIALSDLSDFVNDESISNLGFIVRPRPIEQNVLLPENSDVLYFGPLMMGVGETLTIPMTTTLTILSEGFFFLETYHLLTEDLDILMQESGYALDWE